MSFTAKFKPMGGEGNFVANIIRSKALVYDIRFPEGGRKACFIINVIPAKQKEFEKAIRTPEIFDLNDYGTILYSGWGEPPESVKAEMREKYGMYEG